MTDKINEIVKLLIEKHGGGESFFNELDDLVREESFLEGLYLLAIKESHRLGMGHISFVSTGKFGEAFSDYIKKKDFNNSSDIIVLPGGLREPGKEIYIQASDLRFFQRERFFIDDSFFSGTTFNKINNAFRGRIKKAFVVYDGSREVNPKICSLYRYYDFYKGLKE